MVRGLYKETKAKVFWPFEKKRGLGKDHLGGKDSWERERRRPRRQWERGTQDVFHNNCPQQKLEDWQLTEIVSIIQHPMGIKVKVVVSFLYTSVQRVHNT